MPGWTLHNNWAVKMGIPRSIAAWVNVREDVPKFPKEEQESRYPRVSTQYVTIDDWESVEHKKAWLLHLLIDELEDTMDGIIENAFVDDIDLIDEAVVVIAEGLVLRSPVVRMFGGNSYMGGVLKFFKDNLDEIAEDVFKSIPKI